MILRIAAVTVVTLLALHRAIDAEDWPTYQHDGARTGVTDESLSLPLESAWVHRSRSAPRLAWPGPAKWDGWHKIRGLKDRMTFDRAFQPVVSGDSVFFGSSTDDQVRCLDATTGKTRWKFFTEGPVRFAPTVAEDRVYVGSDDGQIYCLDAKQGKLLWKKRPGPSDLRIPGNGRMISLWPVRTGVVVLDGDAYCCAGVFPWEGVYLAAYDAKTGEARWKKESKKTPAQGYMLASASRLYVMTARDRPVVYDRRDGKMLHQVSGGGGGTYALITGDTLVYGPGKTGEMSLFRAGRKDQLASFRGNHMIVTPRASYLLTDNDLAALDRGRYLSLIGRREDQRRRKQKIETRIKQIDALAKAAKKLAKTKQSESESATSPIAREKAALREELGEVNLAIDRVAKKMETCYPWRVSHEHPLAMILAGSTLFLGGRDSVVAVDTSSGKTLWTAPVTGNVFGLVAANGGLLVSTDRGTIHCFRPVAGDAKKEEQP